MLLHLSLIGHRTRVPAQGLTWVAGDNSPFSPALWLRETELCWPGWFWRKGQRGSVCEALALLLVTLTLLNQSCVPWGTFDDIWTHFE